MGFGGCVVGGWLVVCVVFGLVVGGGVFRCGVWVLFGVDSFLIVSVVLFGWFVVWLFRVRVIVYGLVGLFVDCVV